MLHVLNRHLFSTKKQQIISRPALGQLVILFDSAPVVVSRDGLMVTLSVADEDWRSDKMLLIREAMCPVDRAPLTDGRCLKEVLFEDGQKMKLKSHKKGFLIWWSVDKEKPWKVVE
jgi:hypothetical protein